MVAIQKCLDDGERSSAWSNETLLLFCLIAIDTEVQHELNQHLANINIFRGP